MKKMASYNYQQQVYSLSQTANISFNKRFPTLEALQQYVTNTMNNLLGEPAAQDLIGNWDIIWGPYTWCHYAAKHDETDSSKDKYYSDNTMFLAYNAANNQYILSVAGTNAISWYGWVVEDFNTILTEKWSKLVPNTTAKKAKISEGTYKGVNILLNEITSQYTGTPDGIVTFLKNHLPTAPAGATMAVTGHSLGGALSPTLATYLKETQADWDPSGQITEISTYPTAGPTPGNSYFASHIEAEMGDNYHSAYNKIDVIPHAWQVSMMEQIPSIYEPCGIPESKILRDAVNVLIVLTGLHKYTQAQPMQVLNGTCYKTDVQLVSEIVKDLTPEIIQKLESHGLESIDNFVEFAMEAAYQHTTAYNTLLDREAFSKLFDAATGHESTNNTHTVLTIIEEVLSVFEKSKEQATAQKS